MTNSINSKLLVIATSLFITVMTANIWVLGVGHFRAVKEVGHLTINNQVLMEVVEDVSPVVVEAISIKQEEDSILKLLSRQDSIITNLEQALTLKTKQLEDERMDNVTSPYNTEPYMYSSTGLPSPESP